MTRIQHMLLYKYTMWSTVVSERWHLKIKLTNSLLRSTSDGECNPVGEKKRKIEKNYNVQHKRRGKHEVKWRCHGNAKENGPSPKKTTLDTFSAKCSSLFDYSSVEEAIHVLKLMLAKNCYGIFRFGPSARGLHLFCSWGFGWVDNW